MRAFLLCLAGLYVQGQTPERIKEIFLGRCFDAARTGYAQLNCTNSWALFENTWANKAPRDVTIADWEPYLNSVTHPVPRDRALLWSGSANVRSRIPNDPSVRDTVHHLSNNRQRYWTLEDTIWGSLLNNVTFCEADPTSGQTFNFTWCPDFGWAIGTGMWRDNTYWYPFWSYWPAASIQYARRASGSVRFLGYSPGGPIYRTPTPNFPGSVFGTVEIHNLVAAQIDSFTILIIQGVNASERCQQGSIAQMTRDLTTIAGIPADKIRCLDNPDQVEHLLCVDEWDTAACAFARNARSVSAVPWGMNGSVFGIVNFVIGAAVMALLCCAKQRFTARDTNGYVAAPR